MQSPTFMALFSSVRCCLSRQLMQRRTASVSYLLGNFFFDRYSANFLVVSSASMYTIMGKLLTELCGIAPSSENCCFPLREWDYRQKNTRTRIL